MKFNRIVCRMLAILLLGVIVLNIPVQVCAVSHDIEKNIRLILLE